MYSALPKVLHLLAGKPLLSHVLDTAHALSPQKICVVYGHGNETVLKAITDNELINRMGWFEVKLYTIPSD